MTEFNLLLNMLFGVSSENVCKLKTVGETCSKLIYFCNVDVNVSVKVEQRQGCETLIAHG